MNQKYFSVDEMLVSSCNIFLLSDLCSGYLRKEATVISIVLPFVYHGFAHFTVHLKISSFFSKRIP